MYAFVGKTEKEALVILRVEDPERAVKALTEYQIRVLPSSMVYSF
jgi:hypothetical protein